MARKSKNIEVLEKKEVTQIEKLIKEATPFTLKYDIGEEPLVVNVKPRLNYKDAIFFVWSVVNDITDEEHDLVSYVNKDFSIDMLTLQLYTDIKLPENLETQYELLSTGIISDITCHECFDHKQYLNLLNAIDRQIDFEAKKIQSELKQSAQQYLDQIQSEAETLLNSFEVFAKLFENVKTDDITRLIPKLASMDKLDEKSVVDAVMENQNKILEFKN
jgi:Mg2+ and Co2+ transporter CorA